MNKAQLTNTVQEKLKLTRTEAEKIINTVLDTVVESLKSEGKVSLSGFGTFKVKTRKGRDGKNPFTGQPMSIPPTKNISFKVAQKLKDEL
jgi:nucleoid DNA-binding protein